MTELESLYAFADQCGYDVDFMIMHRAESMSIEVTDEKRAICIDPTRIVDARDEKMKLSHELGHCERIAFYHSYSPYETVGRCERKALVWQIKRLIPRSALDNAIRIGIVSVWDLADYFDVPEWFIRAALHYYHPQ